jgi:hypothetical protein
MSKNSFNTELKKAQKTNLEARKNQLVNKIHHEDKRVIGNFQMMKLSDILQIKETIRNLENGVASCDKQLSKLDY